MPSPGTSIITSWSELASTTFRAHSSDVADQTSKHNALWRRLSEKGQTRIESGGLTIVQPLDYQANSTYQRYSGFDALNIAAVDVLTSAEYAWRQVAVNVAASGLEIRTNMGDNRIVNFTKAKIKNAQRSMANGLSVDVYSDGSLANQIGGLQSIIADTGLGTVGGISANTWAFWANIVQSAAAPLQGGGAVTYSAATIETMMLNLWIKLTRGGDTPDMIVFSDDLFAMYEQSQSSLKRYAPADDGKGGMMSLKYKSADVFFDSSGGIPAVHGYFINTDFMEIVAHRDANMTMMDELRSVNQDAVVIPVLFQGNAVCSARFLQGVLKA
ncbi:hypothetical protein UFOVP1165_55 [uncultured Caudovirales phage]|uniref:Phage major capsid protein n=1 Tax=uncultured Caudovirales phage TaxID=2100421 RepID=A0A6J5QWL4_9CAUD|nr:hypothetical protein UFOVP1165_55 [uncultured Caudovirales phage]